MRASRRAVALGLVLMLVATAPAAAVTITEFPVGNGPRYIHPGPDGNLWFAYDAGVGRISPAGEQFAPIPDAHYPVDIVTAPDGTVYWAGDTGVGRRIPFGTVDTPTTGEVVGGYGVAVTAQGALRWGARNYGVCFFAANFGQVPFNCTGVPGRTTDITLGPDGRLWSAHYEANQIRRSDLSATTYDLTVDLPAGSGPVRIAAGPDGNLWVTMFDASAIDRITPTGIRTRFPLAPGLAPNDITAGPDGALWFNEYQGNRIGRMTTAGTVTDAYPIPTPGARSIGIAAGPDGAIWFTESTAGKIGRLRLDPTQASGPGGGGGGGGGGGAGAVSDRLAPRFLGRPVLTPARFRVSGGSTLTFSLSEASTVTLTDARRRTGRRVGGVCRARTRANRSRPRCTRYVTVGSLRRDGRAGVNSIRLSGRVNGRALGEGVYRLTLRARDAAGNRSTPQTVAFTVVG